jgi:hypothetical protein
MDTVGGTGFHQVPRGGVFIGVAPWGWGPPYPYWWYYPPPYSVYSPPPIIVVYDAGAPRRNPSPRSRPSWRMLVNELRPLADPVPE